MNEFQTELDRITEAETRFVKFLERECVKLMKEYNSTNTDTELILVCHETSYNDGSAPNELLFHFRISETPGIYDMGAEMFGDEIYMEQISKASNRMVKAYNLTYNVYYVYAVKEDALVRVFETYEFFG